jgi:hypothetical protein
MHRSAPHSVPHSKPRSVLRLQGRAEQHCKVPADQVAAQRTGTTAPSKGQPGPQQGAARPPAMGSQARPPLVRQDADDLQDVEEDLDDIDVDVERCNDVGIGAELVGAASHQQLQIVD